MKKKSQQKEFLIKKSQLETLQKYEDNFVMVKYSDTKLVPNQAKVLGFIRGMIKNNQKNLKMKVFNKVWMKETTKRMSFLLGIGESTLKDHIKLLEEKGYLKRANHSVGLDNTNWYWIDENNLQNDYRDYLLKLELEVNELSKVFELDSRLPEFTNSKHENQLVCSQKMAIENPETNSTILYNSSRILENEVDNIVECSNNDIKSEIIVDDNTSPTNLKLDKNYCFNELNKILPNGWYDFLLNNNQEKLYEKYDNYFTHYSDQELLIIFAWTNRVLE
jgi:DNA-binding MarR family transcriptional regulator